MTDVIFPFRVHAGFLTALAGGATAQSMVLRSGSLGHFLPQGLLLGALAVCGAGLAGLVYAGALGRRGWQGWLILLFIWPLTTASGAILAVVLPALLDSAAGIEGRLDAMAIGAGLAILAVSDGILTSAPVAFTWVASGVLVHCALRAQRDPT